MSGQGSTGNIIAAVCSFFIPGLGQLVQARLLPALLFFLVVTVSWWLASTILLAIVAVPVALLVHLWAIVDAALWKR